MYIVRLLFVYISASTYVDFIFIVAFLFYHVFLTLKFPFLVSFSKINYFAWNLTYSISVSYFYSDF